MKSDMRTLLWRPGVLNEGSFPLLIQLLTDLRETPQILAILPGFTKVFPGSLLLNDSIVSPKTPASGIIFFSLWSGSSVHRYFNKLERKKVARIWRKKKETPNISKSGSYRQGLPPVIEAIISLLSSTELRNPTPVEVSTT